MPAATNNVCAPRGSILWVIGLLVLLSGAYFFQSGQHNENSRYAQVRALVEDGRWDIGRYAARTADVITIDGKVYPNKAPGLTLAALPAWWAVRMALRPLGLDENLRLNLTCYFTNILTVGLTTALSAVLLFVLIEFLTASAWLALWLTLAYAFGTLAFPFATLFFSHQFAAWLLLTSFALLFFTAAGAQTPAAQDFTFRRWAAWAGRRPGIAVLISGFCAGFAATTEYPAALGGALIGLYLLSRAELRWRLLFFAAGGVLGVLPHLFYTYAAFGKLLYIPYAAYTTGAASMFPEHAKGFLGVELPKLGTLQYITLSLQRGLLVVNPWLILLVPALSVPLGVRCWRRELGTCLLMVVVFLLFNASYNESIAYAGGGASVGPRHSIPMLAFAVLAIAPLLRHGWLRFGFYLLALASAAIMLMAVATEPRVPYEYLNPLVDLFWRGYLRADLATQWDGVFSSRLLTENSVSFNLGKLAGLPGPFQLWPLFVFWLIMAGGLARLAVAADVYRAEKRRSGEDWLCDAGTRGAWLQCAAAAGGAWYRVTLLFRRSEAALSVIALWLAVLAILPLWHGPWPVLDRYQAPGLFGVYSRGVRWRGCGDEDAALPAGVEPMLSRVDEYLIFPWQEGGAPDNGAFSVRWSGLLNVERAGEYQFVAYADDGACVYLDGRLVVDNWGMHDAAGRGQIFLRAGQHRLVVRYSNMVFTAKLYLMWMPPGEHLQLVPRRVLEADFRSPPPRRQEGQAWPKR